MDKGKGLLSKKVAPAWRRGVNRSKIALTKARYGELAKNLRIIVVTGHQGETTTARFVDEILREAHFKTVLMSGKSDSLEHSDLKLSKLFAKVKKTTADYAILALSEPEIEQMGLSGLTIEALVLTNSPPKTDLQGATPEDLSIARLLRLNPRFIALSRDDGQFESLNQLAAREQKMTYGRHGEAEARIDRTKDYPKGTEVDIVLDHQTHLELATFLIGEDNVYNLTASTTLAYMLGVKLEDIQEGVANVE